jgi:hypothetical protein
MPWFLASGWLWKRRPGKRPNTGQAKSIARPVYPGLEALERRDLFAVNVWLPQRLLPIEGSSQPDQPYQLFQPAGTSLQPTTGLTAATVTLAGSFSLTDTGAYSLSLSEAGPFGSNDCFVFSESGTLSFSVTEQGSVGNSGFSTGSVAPTQTVSLAWSFLETDGAGNTIQYTTGSDAFTVQANGATPGDPYFWDGFNWHDPTWQLSARNNLGLTGLAATSLTVTESGTDSFDLEISSGTATITGSGSQPLYDHLTQSGQQSYTDTVSESFTASNHGQDTFSLSEQGSYDGSNFALSSVAFSESGQNSLAFTDTLTEARGGTETANGSQAFSGNLHTFGAASSESFQFSDLTTSHYSESASASYSLYEGGSYGAGSFSLGSLNFSEQGSGGLTLAQTATQTQTGTETATDNAASTDSLGVSGTLTDSGTATLSGNYTYTSLETLQETDSGTFSLSELGGYGNSSWALSTFSLSESASGTVTDQLLDTFTESGSGTITDGGAGTDSYALNYQSVNTTSAQDTASYQETITESFTETSTDSSTATGTDSFSLTEIGSSSGGSIALSSYALSTSETDSYATADTFTEAATATGTAFSSGTDSGTHATSGAVSNTDLGNDSFQDAATFTQQSSETAAFTDTGTFSDSSAVGGSFSGGHFAFGTVSLSQAASDSWIYADSQSSTATGTESGTDSQTGQSAGSVVSGGVSSGGLGNTTSTSSTQETFTDTDTSTLTEGGGQSWSLSEQGTYGGDSYSLSSVVYQATGSFGGTFQEVASDSYAGSGSDSYTSSSNQSSTSALAVTSGSGLGSSTEHGTASFNLTAHSTLTQTTATADSWSVYEAGSCAAGTWSLSSVSYGESDSDSFTVQQTDSASDSGTETVLATATLSGGQTSVYGGGSVTGLDTVLASSTATDSYTDSSADTLTQSGSDSWSLSEQGSFAGFAFSLSSVVSQGGAHFSETWTAAETHAFTGNESDSRTEQSQGHAAGTYAAASDSSVNSFTDTSTDSFTTAGSSVYSETLTAGDTSSFYEAGSYAEDSFNLSSVNDAEAFSAQFAYQGGDTQTDAGQETLLYSGSGNGRTAINGDSATNSLTASATLTGSAGDTTTDAYSGSGGDSWSFSEQGTYAGFSYSLNTVVYQEAGSFTDAETDTASDSYSFSGTDSSTSEAHLTRHGNYGLSVASGQSDFSGGGSDGVSQSGSDSSSQTVSSTDSWSLYQAGSYAGGSFSLASVNYSESATDSFSLAAGDSSTDVSQQTQTLSGTVTSLATLAFDNPSSPDQSRSTFTSGQTVSGLQTSTSAETLTATGGDSWSLSEQGTYGGYSYSLSSVVFQATETSTATVQASDGSAFAGTFNAAAGTSQQDTYSGGGTVTGAGSQGSATQADSTASTEQDAAGDSLTVSETETWTLYEAGSYAGDSFAFASVSDTSSSQSGFTLTATDSSTVSLTLADSWAVDQNTWGTGGYLSSTYNSLSTASNGVTVSANLQATHQAALTLTGGDSATLSEAGSFANDSYAFSSIQQQSTDSYSFSGQETDTLAETLTASGGDTASSADTSTSLIAAAGFGGQSWALVTISDHDTTGAIDGFTGTLTAATTASLSEAGTFTESAFESGSYAAGSFAFSSMSYSTQSTDSWTQQTQDSLTVLDTLSSQESLHLSHQGAHTGDGYTVDSSSSFSQQDTFTATDTLTQQSLSTYALYEAGSFSGQSWSLSSFSLLDASTTTTTLSASQAEATTRSGSYSDLDVEAGITVNNISGTFTSSSSSSETVAETFTTGYSLSEQGTFSQGTFSLSSFAFSEQQTSTVRVSDAASSSGTYTGSNSASGTAVAFSGVNASSSSDQTYASRGGSLSEQGTYSGGSFNLGTVTYAGSGTDSYNAQDSSTASWPSGSGGQGTMGGGGSGGGYSGNDTASDQSSGNDSYSVSATGSFSGGSWSLSSYALSGGAVSSYADSSAHQQTLGYSSSSASRTESGQESVSVSQAGTEQAGNYTNTSYAYQEQSGSTVTNQAQESGYQSHDTWTQQHSSQVDSSGNVSDASAATYSYQDNQGSGTISNNQSSSGTQDLPGPAVVLVNPDGSVVPLAGVDQPGGSDNSGVGGNAPVSGQANLQVVADTGQWLTTTDQVSKKAVTQGSDPGHTRETGLQPGTAGSGGGTSAGGVGVNPSLPAPGETITTPVDKQVVIRFIQVLKDVGQNSSKLASLAGLIARAGSMAGIGLAGAGLSMQLTKQLGGNESSMLGLMIREKWRNTPLTDLPEIKPLVKLARELGISQSEIKDALIVGWDFGSSGKQTRRYDWMAGNLKKLIRDRLTLLQLIRMARQVGIPDREILQQRTLEDLQKRILRQLTVKAADATGRELPTDPTDPINKSLRRQQQKRARRAAAATRTARPPYRANPAHNPNSPLYDRRKGPEPTDAREVYESATQAGEKTWYGKSSTGEVYRYFSDNAGGVHFSGRTGGPQPLRLDDIPVTIRRQLGIR